MTRELLLKAIEDAIREECESARDKAISAESRLVEDLGLDSLDLVAVVLKLDDQYQVPIAVQEIRNFRAVSDLLDLLTPLLCEQAAAA